MLQMYQIIFILQQWHQIYNHKNRIDMMMHYDAITLPANILATG